MTLSRLLEAGSEAGVNRRIGEKDLKLWVQKLHRDGRRSRKEERVRNEFTGRMKRDRGPSEQGLFSAANGMRGRHRRQFWGNASEKDRSRRYTTRGGRRAANESLCLQDKSPLKRREEKKEKIVVLQDKRGESCTRGGLSD